MTYDLVTISGLVTVGQFGKQGSASSDQLEYKFSFVDCETVS